MKEQYVNRDVLKEKMYQIHWTQGILAEYLGISRCAVNVKMSGRRDFSEKEISLMKSKFGTSIFFGK